MLHQILTTLILMIAIKHIRSFSSVANDPKILKRIEWQSKAEEHAKLIYNMVYPPSNQYENDKERMHAVYGHPIYNFIHKYYSYSLKQISFYSPGMNILLEEVHTKNDINHILSPDFFNSIDSNKSLCNGMYEIERNNLSNKKRKKFERSRDILLRTSIAPPHFSCFGLHEWAMLAKGDGKENKHQTLPLRVPQNVIDKMVQSKGALRCTHFDAFRFFHPDVTALNDVQLSRSNQLDTEQPGCVHATMDLFKYAYELYPLISADTLRDCLQVSLDARHIDMRASPYDCSTVEGVGDPIKIETAVGRKQYASEQEVLYKKSAPIRLELLRAYEAVLT